MTTDLLIGRDTIAETYKVSPSEVTEWAKEGAPIFLCGRKYATTVQKLTEWLVSNKPVKSFIDGVTE